MFKRSAFRLCSFLAIIGLPGFLAVCLLLPSVVTAQSKADLRILVDGKQQLFRKVIVTGETVTIHKTDDPTSPPEPVKPFAIYTKLKLDKPDPESKHEGETSAKGGAIFIRVGDFSFPPRPLGYLKVKPRQKRLDIYKPPRLTLTEDDLAKLGKEPTFQEEVSEDFVDWNTRSAFWPKLGAADPLQTHLLPTYDILATEFKKQAGGEQKLVMLPMLDKARNEKDQIHPVVCFIGTTQGANNNKLDVTKLNLEIVFAIDTTASMTPLLEGAKKAVQDTVDQITKDPNLKGVRFGVVAYEDCTPAGKNFFNGKDHRALIPARVISKLTDNYQQLKTDFAALKVAEMGSEEPAEDVIAGLKMALDKKEMGWSDNSSKHIILIGDASALLTDPSDPTKLHPKNSTKLGYADILKMSAATNATSEFGKYVGTTYFHAIHVQLLKEDREFKEAREDNELAQKQFKELSKNDNRFEGYFTSVDTNDQKDRERVVMELSKKLQLGYSGIASVRIGDLKGAEEASKQSQFADAAYQACLVTTGKLPPVTFGFAGMKSKNGREVAEVRYMISVKELTDLKNTLLHLHNQWSELKQDERDVAKILDDVDKAIALSITGQGIARLGDSEREKKSLQDLISDLPLTPGVLNLTILDLANKDEKQFKSWLTSLKQTADFAKGLLEEATRDKKDAMLVDFGVKGSDGKPKTELFLFLHKNALP